ncbi:MAG: hypothetical protein NC922_00795 [Candidatus Omnitrophica bacterium]|nr:hypothetical protein [Candidatus Omnitrophota bacterium]
MKTEEIKKFFLKSKEKNRIFNAYIIYGGNKKEREEIALFFAGVLNCKNENYCESCENCKKIKNKSHPDIRWVIPEKSILSIDDVREIKKDLFIQPYSGKYKIYIFQIEYIKEEASSAFLKILEEPPPYGILILLVPNINFLLPTIISRCFKIYLNYKLPDYNKEMEKAKEEFWELIKDVENKNFFDFFKKIDFMSKNKEREEVEKWIEDILYYIRDLFLQLNNFPQSFLIDKNLKNEKHWTFEISLIEKIWNIKQRIRYNINVKLALENIVFQVILNSLKFDK